MVFTQRYEDMKNLLLSLALVFLLCTQALAESSVWKIQKGESVMYIGGTFHLLRQSDFPLPSEFEKAYRLSDILVFETDIGRFNEPLTQQKLLAKARYADGSTVDKHLSADTYKLLRQYCATNGIPLDKIKSYKPSFITLIIVTNELGKLGVVTEGVDTFFYKLATTDNKATQGLETVDTQIDFIVRMGEGNEDEFLTNAINDVKRIENTFETMVDAWERGDATKLDELIISEVKAKTPKLYQEMFLDRNNNWLPAIESYQDTPQKEFILVGAGHLVGPDGIIEALRKNGYKIEKL